MYEPNEDGHGGHYVRKSIKKRLINKQYLIVARGAAKSQYESYIQSYYLNVDMSTTHQVHTSPTMRQAEEVLAPMRTSILRSRGPLFQFLTEGSIQNTTGNRAERVKLASTKKGIENFFPIKPQVQRDKARNHAADEHGNLRIGSQPHNAAEHYRRKQAEGEHPVAKLRLFFVFSVIMPTPMPLERGTAKRGRRPSRVRLFLSFPLYVRPAMSVFLAA